MNRTILSIRAFDSSPDALARFCPALSGRDRPRLCIPKLDLVAGRCHAVIGRSGAGKTVLNSLLLGLPSTRVGRAVRVGEMSWWNGTVPVRSDDFRSSSRLLARWREVRQKGTLLYLPQILPDGRGYQMSVKHYLEQVVAALLRQADRKAEGLGDPFETFPDELRGVLPNPVTSLSGGERRRVELWARLAVLKSLPDDRLGLLILDEPTTGLDVPDERRYLEDLRRLMKDLPNLAVLVTTHALYFLDDRLPPSEASPARREPLFDRVVLVHKERPAGHGCGKSGPVCRVTDATDSQALCDAVRRRAPDKSVEDAMEDFVAWQAGCEGEEFSERVQKTYFENPNS